MDVSGILQKIDLYFEQNKGAEAEKLLKDSIALAVEEQDDGSLLQLLNELVGYYRETGRAKEAFAMAKQAISLAERMGLSGSIPYATTLLNAANACRAGGRLKESEELYLRVRSLYNTLLPASDMLTAGLENNISLLYQEMGDFGRAKECLLKALSIARENGAGFETAVTCANLAGTCMQLKQDEEAYGYACRAIEDFEKMQVQDVHYCAALSALGTYFYQRRDYDRALENFQKAQGIVEKSLGKNGHYYRLEDNIQACREALGGMSLCREYFETYGKPMLETKFPEYADKIAVGLAGEGSDCFGYDDAASRDHDWGPDFCMWVTEETWNAVGDKLQEAYGQLPGEFKGFKRKVTPAGQGRRGVMKISSFFERLLQADSYEKIDWRNVPDAALAAAVNGEVFQDGEGSFTAFRARLLEGYPEQIRYLKLAEAAARFTQAAQYNYQRMKKRGDVMTARILLSDGIREAMKLQHYIEGKYPPHDKWLFRSTGQLSGGKELCSLLQRIDTADREGREVSDPIEQTAAFLAGELYENNFTSDTEPYLDAHTQELLYKAGICVKSNAELVEEIVKAEFEAFDKVRNVGGRASCQNDWPTFSIMRKSQYLTWNRTMLLQYLYDFQREYRRGHNLIEEKYGRMMESTAPEEYAGIKDHFPAISPEKQQIIQQVTALQVSWMEDFAVKYPALADNARSVHSYDDNLYNTSYETYLRGEISTYSDKMLELYGRYVVEYAKENRNLAFEIMTNSVKLYGYRDLDSAEAFLKG